VLQDYSFDEVYKNEECFWGKKPSRTVRNVLKYKKTGSVLDFGVGEGRNALFLSKYNFRITGIDISPNAIDKFLNIAKQQNLSVIGKVGNILNFEFKEYYDIVLLIEILHYLYPNEIVDVIERMKKNTNHNGLHVVDVFTEDNPPDKLPFPHLFKRNELKSYYSDFKILSYKEWETPLQKHGKENKLHRHVMASIIAQKVL
jgi:tellurite methyltransferase